MALRSWLASLKTDVTHVTAVTNSNPIATGGGLRCNVMKNPDVTDVTEMASPVDGGDFVTAVTSWKNQTLQPNTPAVAIEIGVVTGVTAVTCKKINAGAGAVNELLIDDLTEVLNCKPKRLFRQAGPWLTDTKHSAAQAYHAHHFNCHPCIAAGRGSRYGRRCDVGLALWSDYAGADNLQTQGA